MVTEKTLTPYENHFEHLQDILALVNLRLGAIQEGFPAMRQSEVSDFRFYIQERLEVSGQESLPFFYIIESIPYDSFDDLMAVKKRLQTYLSSPEAPLTRPWLSLISKPALSVSPVLVEDVRLSLEHLIRAFLPEAPFCPHLICVYGENGVGRKTHVYHLAVAAGLSVFCVNMQLLLREDSFFTFVHEIVLESMLQNAVLCIDHIDLLFEEEHLSKTLLFFKIIQNVSGLAFCTSRESISSFVPEEYAIAEIHIPMPYFSMRKSLWEYFGASYKVADPLYASDFAARFTLTPLQIKKSLEDAHARAVMSGSHMITSDILSLSARSQSAHKLSSLGVLVDAVFGWEDLVLPADTKEFLRSAIHRVSYASKVYDEWEFGKKLPYGRGIPMLFAGPPGTGKTMAAQVMAGKLGLALYKVDLASVVSKYIGETEKNLKIIFEQAKNSNCILFFDEADSLFGKRTEVKDAHDRHANLEVSYLLQKLEEHEGITILATNLIKNFDDAFKRRFKYIIDFPFPDESARLLIWQSVFPSNMPLSKDLDFAYLARQFKLSGSNIKNIALAAAFRAASEDRIVSMNDILAAVKEESAKTGAPLTSEDLGMYGVL